MDGKSLNLTAEKVARLRAIFPDVFAEDKIDFARLKDVLGENIAFPNEHYELSWAGKAEARKEIQKQTTATLVPNPNLTGFENLSGLNVFIEGENLQVLRILQKAYFGKVKMIYIDPPYNTGNDSFVYPDDYAERLDEYKKRAGITDSAGYLNKQDLWHKNTRENGQFHSVWLSMMYPRLYLARNLLREDGVIFVSIDDNEVANLKLLMDEVFGPENFVETFIWRSRLGKGSTAKETAKLHEYILCYAKDINLISFKGDIRTKDRETRERMRQWGQGDSRSDRPTMYYAVHSDEFGEVFPKKPDGTDGRWRVSKEKFLEAQKQGLVVFEKQSDGRIEAYRIIPEGTETKTAQDSILDTEKAKTTAHGSIELTELFGMKVFDYSKPKSLIHHFIGLTDDKNALVFDFFAGSGTTAQAVLELNEEDGGRRQFILVQMPEQLDAESEAYKAGYRTIADICQARIRKVIEKLAANDANQRESNNQTKLFAEIGEIRGKPNRGFQTFRIAPSNFKQWRDVEGKNAILEQLDIFRHSEKETSESAKMLYEILLKAGFPLTAKIETAQVDGQTVYVVEDGKLLACFDGFNAAIQESIHARKPQRVICLDRVFNGDDQAITNLKLELQEAGIELTII
jgi:adenine-specific DNA-methyltransferase